MAGKRRRFTPEFKARVALEALRERDSLQAIAMRRELHPNQVRTWRRQLLEGLPKVFVGARAGSSQGSTRRSSGSSTRRSESSRLSGIFFGAGASAGPGGAGADDRAGRAAESFETVCAAGREPVVAVLPAKGESAEDLALMRRMDELHMASENATTRCSTRVGVAFGIRGCRRSRGRSASGPYRSKSRRHR